jgi:cytochrome P450
MVTRLPTLAMRPRHDASTVLQFGQRNDWSNAFAVVACGVMQLPTVAPRHVPLLGHLPRMALNPIKFFTQLSERYGDVVPLRMGVSRALFVNRPELIHQLIRDRNSIRSEESRIGIRSFVGDGLLALEGPTHLRHRRLMAPAFHRERFREYGALMCEETYREIARWAAPETRNVHEDMSRLTFSIVSKALFTVDPQAHSDSEADEVGRALKQVLPWMLLGAVVAGVAPWLPVLYPPSARVALKRLKQLVRNIIARRRREGGDRGDLLSMLLAARDEDGGALSDEVVCDEALTLLMAGHDTTASTMTWALYLLAQNPELQASAAQQVRDVLEEARAEHVGVEHLPKLPLVQQIIDETLRLFPVVWIGDRTPQQPMQLGPYEIPAGMRIMFSMLVTQRDARFFKDPERFDPSRFAPERVSQIPEGAYMPFGAGVHMCIGINFALMESRVILAALLHHFSFVSVPDYQLRLDPQVVLSPIGSLPLVVQKRPPRGGMRSTG